MEEAKILMKFYKTEGFLASLRIIKNYMYWFYKKYFSKDKLILKKIQGSKMYLASKEGVGVSKSLLIVGSREKLSTEILKKELKKGMVVMDLGANIGYYALMEALIVGKKGKVYAVEPEPNNFKLLKKNIKVNNYKNIEVYPIAISNKTGKAKFHLASSSSTHTLNQYGENLTGKYINMDVISYSNFVKNKKSIDLVRMDIEGGEIEVFKDMIKHPKKLPKKISFEPHYYKNTEIRNILDKLSSFGFKIKAVVSTREPAKEFKKLGYKPKKVIASDGTYRGLYEDITLNDLKKLIYPNRPYHLRVVLLERKAR